MVDVPTTRSPLRPERALWQLMLKLRARYCNTPLNAVVSLALFGIIVLMLVRVFDWAVLNGVWNAGSVAACRKAASGACWAVLRVRFRLILFGLYPFDQQWRPSLACTVMLLTFIASCVPALWRPRRLAALWIAAYIVFLGLMRGGFWGMPVVITDNWGGLALTFLLFSSAMILGMPLALLLALCRRSNVLALRLLSGALVDFLRTIPLMAVLFAFAIVLPVMLPNASGDKLVRVILGFTLFFACYQAENFRGGLQAVEKGQAEAAISLGMKYWQYHLKIILPQVFRTVLPQTVNQVVSCFKDTSYVALVGFFDMTASASAALGEGQWALAFVEVYLVVGLIYLGFCYSLSQYGGYLERRADIAYVR